MKKLNLTLTFALVTGLFIFTSCEKDEDPVMDSGMTGQTNDQSSIVDLTESNSNFSILADALTKTELSYVLDGPGSYTVFAPTNEAFEMLFMDLGVSSIEEIPAESLRPILLYHVLGEFKTSDMIRDGYYSSSSPAQGRTVSMYIDTYSGVVINETATVIEADIVATNGVIHAIDEVLLPPSVVDLAVQNDNFTTLVSAVVDAGLAGTLSDAAGTFTVFAPTNAAFAALTGEVPSDLTPILLYHVLGSPVFSDAVASGSVSSLNSSDPEIQILVDNNGVVLNGSAKVIITDIVGTNGIIHVIDRVLLP